MNHRSKGQLMCRLEGCPHEVLFKTVDSGGGSGGGYVDPLERRASIIRDRNGHTLQGRGSPAGAGAAGGGGYDARCPVPECSQARLQYLDPAYESRHGDSLPVYQRWEYCADHGCRADGCKKLVLEKQICCEEREISLLCHPARHNVADTKEYLRFCVDHATCAVNRCKDMKIEQSLYCANHTCRERGCSKSSQSKPFCSEHCCAEVNCRYPRPWAASPNPRGKFCPLHCPEFVDRLAIFCRTHGCSKPKCHEEVIVEGFCLDHLKAHYITQGELKARGGSSSSPKDSPTTTTGHPTTMTTRPNPAQPPTFPRRLSQQSIASIRPGPGPGQRPTSILLHGHAHEILIPPDEHPDELLDHSRDDPIRFQLNQVVAQQHARQAYQAHVDDPDPDLDNDDNEDNDDDGDDDDLNDHHLPPNLNPSKPGGGSGSGRSSLSSEAVSALSDNENIGAAGIVNGSLVNGNGGGGAESPGDPPEYSKVAAPGSIVSVGQGQGQAQGQGQGQGHGEGGETKTGGGSRREERERERNRRKVLERDGGTGTGGGVGMPGSFVGGGDGKGEDSDGW
ncbi:hypothetical protein NEUTE1DRAFT_102215 [Neurospora tetrasperma FGSC 2508]|uniref:Uncharacterized protein n=1 Tax=Neurospora tetrasperma (strain FGSC 2508 / ATCC MYA-4615 / P0657) TaxID=510951 RepID=F8MNJ1_NEUT8|nr:uncharacterized protein NEUTE1DRAFT_102215 [Neurospora tetrasperma FGSC 2508]EGO56959.1 hypothetical protein NEUTE1DRAFT_102215 [Neurospora tetrasperma FGSC 2508]